MSDLVAVTPGLRTLNAPACITIAASPINHDAVLALVDQGRSHRAVAEMLGISRGRVSQIAKAHGRAVAADRRQRGLSGRGPCAVDRDAILAKLLTGASRNTTARDLGVTRYAVETVAAEHRDEHPILSAPKRHTGSPPRRMPIPRWALRAGLAQDYRDYARVFDEFAAARHCRGLLAEAARLTTLAARAGEDGGRDA